MDGGWMVGGASLTVVWEEPARHGGGVGHPGSGVDGTNRFTFRTVDKVSDVSHAPV